MPRMHGHRERKRTPFFLRKEVLPPFERPERHPAVKISFYFFACTVAVVTAIKLVIAVFP